MTKPLVMTPRKAQAEALRVKFALWTKHNKLPEAVPELRFHHARKWAFDFAFPDYLVAVEVDGGLWVKGGGGHNRGAAVVRDMEKLNAAASLGWRVLRVTPDGVFTEYFATTLRSALEYGRKS